MYAENEYPNIHVWLDDEKYVQLGEVAECLAYGNTDFIGFTNEGSPVWLGNSYARYEFVALNHGYVFTYALGPIEVEKLNEEGELMLEPFAWNDIDEVRSAYDC